jgi:hypothetical protein
MHDLLTGPFTTSTDNNINNIINNKANTLLLFILQFGLPFSTHMLNQDDVYYHHHVSHYSVDLIGRHAGAASSCLLLCCRPPECKVVICQLVCSNQDWPLLNIRTAQAEMDVFIPVLWQGCWQRVGGCAASLLAGQ